MFRDLNGFYQRRKHHPEPISKGPHLTAAQQTMLMWALGLELLLLFLAPVSGASVITALLYIAR